MNVQPLSIDASAARVALGEYKQHRAVYDKRDWEIERIYRQIAKGKTVISVIDSVFRGGIDQLGRPRLAVTRADQTLGQCDPWSGDQVRYWGNDARFRSTDLYFQIPWPNRAIVHRGRLQALVPRIPPQYRPAQAQLSKYHILWEADWTAIPRDPMLLKRIGKDAWVVLAAWDLTDVELSVLRAHQPR